MKIKHEIWCSGSGDKQPLLDWGAESTLSPAFIPDCRLENFFWSVFPKTLHWHSLDLVFTPGHSLLGKSLEQPASACRWCSHLMLTGCPKVHAFMILVILPSGSGLGVCNKAIILRKTWINIMQFLNICCFCKCYFCEVSQGCESTLLGIPTTRHGYFPKEKNTETWRDAQYH